MKKILLIILFTVPFVAAQSQTKLLSGCSTTSSIIAESCSFFNSPSGNYTWSTSGIYVDTILNAAGCDSIMTIDLTINQAPMVILGPDVSMCQGESVLLNAGGGGGMTFLWNTGETTQSIIAFSAGVYTVTVYDMNGCSGSDDISVIVYPAPVAYLGPDVSICQGESIVLDAGGIPGGMYLWSTGETTQSINAFNGGVYTVTVVNTYGCSGSDDIAVTIIPLPVPGILPSYTICQGQSVVLDALGPPFVDYIWSTGATTQTITVTTAGAYTVTVTNASGCTGTGTTLVTVNPIPIAVLSGNATMCQGNSTNLVVSFTGTPPFTYSYGDGMITYGPFTTNQNPQIIPVSPSGNTTYTLIMIADLQCTGTASGSANITINPIPLPVITGDSTLCPGQSTVLDPGAGYANYLWNTGTTTQVLPVTTFNTFIVTVTDANGCTGSDSFTTMAAPPYATTLTASGTLGICQGDSVQLTEPNSMSTYQWYRYNTLLAGATTSSLWISTPGLYKCLSTDVQNCPAASNQLRVRIVCFPPPPPIERIAEPGSGISDMIRVYPNPSSGVFNVEWNGETDVQYRMIVSNLVGQEIFFEELIGNSVSVDLSAFPQGMYILRISQGISNQYIRMIKSE